MKAISDEVWKKANKWETGWWRTCHNTLIEDLKQMSNTKRMGLMLDKADSLWIDCHGKSILDVGGGVTSLLLKCVNFKEAVVVDPLPMPEWVKMRYKAANIQLINDKAEGLSRYFESGKKFDEAWIYNCLQHVQDPENILRETMKVSKLIRMHEWVDVIGNEGHPQTLTKKELDDILGGNGEVRFIMERFMSGKAYYGSFEIKEK